MKNLTEELKSLGFPEESIETILHNQSTTQCYIPKKAKVVLQRHIPKTALRVIHIDTDIAIELCLLVLSTLTSTIHSDSNKDGWKALSSELLHELTKNPGDNTYLYSKIIRILKAGSKEKGPIIEVRKNGMGAETYIAGKKSKQYRLTDTYKVGTEVYTLTTPHLIRRRQNTYNKSIIKAVNNPIALNCLRVMSMVNLPSEKEILRRGRELVKQGHKTNKGKVLTMRNKNSNSNWVDASKRSFVEDNIEQFKMLTDIGMYVPMIGDYKSGGRVVDSFTLMPSWIRDMIVLEGESISECDYSALHPNLSNNLYGMNTETITHEAAAKYLGIDRREAKIENLSFFNKQEAQMKESPLWSFYEDKHPIMLERVIAEKRSSEFGYKITSMELFKAETRMMSEAIEELNEQGIYVIYVYDALYCQSSMKQEVKNVMDRVALDSLIRTTT